MTNFKIDRVTKHQKIAFPGIADATGKKWVLEDGASKSIFLFSPHRSVFSNGVDQYIIEPLHYNEHSGVFSDDEHVLLEMVNGTPEKIGSLTCAFPIFTKSKFKLTINEETLTMKGKNRAWSSPNLDSHLTSKTEGDIWIRTKFLGPADTDGKPSAIDAAGELNCSNTNWSPYLFCLVFFAEMEMVHTIIKAKK